MGGGGFRLWRRQVNLEKFGTNKGFIFSILVLSTLFERVWWPSRKSWNKMEVVVYKQIFLLYKFAFMNFFDGITPYASKTPLKVRSEKRASGVCLANICVSEEIIENCFNKKSEYKKVIF